MHVPLGWQYPALKQPDGQAVPTNTLSMAHDEAGCSSVASNVSVPLHTEANQHQKERECVCVCEREREKERELYGWDKQGLHGDATPQAAGRVERSFKYL